MFRMALFVTSLALAISALVLPAAQGKPLTPATLPGEHGQVVASSANTTQARSDVPGSFAYGIGNAAEIGNAAILTELPAPPDERGDVQGIGNATTTGTRSDDRGYAQGIGDASTTGTRPDDRGFAQGIGRAATAETSSGSSLDWATLLAAIGVGLGLFALVAGGVMTTQRRQGEKLAV